MSPFAGISSLPAALAEKVIGPTDPGFDEARRAWNLLVDQRPAAVVLAESADDVAAAVYVARREGLRVAAQGTGHNAGPLDSLSGTILIKTERMRGVRVDAAKRSARAEAGAIWADVVSAAAEHGLVALAGSSPNVGVVGYTIGGGLGFLGRKYGLAANHVQAIEVVTATGEFVRVDRDHMADLFWALRGGGGSFGVVTAIEFELFAVTEAYAGVLWYPIERAAEVLDGWRQLTQGGPPDELTTVAHLVSLPPLEEIPEAVRGKSFVTVAAYHVGERHQADELLRPLRTLGPMMDTVETIPASTLSAVLPDPTGPIGYLGDGVLLAELPEKAVDALVQVAANPTPSPLTSLELRHLEGELGRTRPGSGAAASIDAPYVLYAVGMAPAPELHAPVEAQLEELRSALGPWTAPQMFLNLVDSSQAPGVFWTGENYRRLQQIKASVDPDNLFHANHPVRQPSDGETSIQWRTTSRLAHMTSLEETERNRSTMTAAFEAWRDEGAPITDTFAPDMTWRIEGRSAVSRSYSSRSEFIAEVLAPFARRFSTTDPFRPVNIRGVYADDHTVIVLWDGRGTTVNDTIYENTYAWFLRIRDDRVIDGVAFYDSISFNELWATRGCQP